MNPDGITAWQSQIIDCASYWGDDLIEKLLRLGKRKEVEQQGRYILIKGGKTKKPVRISEQQQLRYKAEAIAMVLFGIPGGKVATGIPEMIKHRQSD